MYNRVKKKHRYRSMFFMKKYKKNSNFNQKFINFYTVFLPKVISLDGRYRNHLLNCLIKLNESITSGTTNILFDFKDTTLIVAHGMIVLYAEVKNILNYNNEIKFKCCNIKTNRVEQVLKQIKFFSLCKHKSKVKLTRNDVVHWRFCSGVSLIYDKFDDVVLYDTIFKELPTESDLYAGCVEATKNVIKHAYIEKTRELPISIDKEAWWCFTQVKDKKLHMVICDLGITIPYTLPKNKPSLMQLLLNLFGDKMSDADLLEGAIGTPSSRSGESYRGNGLPKIAEIARVKGGSLSVYSRHGHVKYTGEHIIPVKKAHKLPLNGTVIAWMLPLGGGKNEDNIHS